MLNIKVLSAKVSKEHVEFILRNSLVTAKCK